MTYKWSVVKAFENSNVFTALYFYDAYLVAPKKSTSPPAEQFSASERCSFLYQIQNPPVLQHLSVLHHPSAYFSTAAPSSANRESTTG